MKFQHEVTNIIENQQWDNTQNIRSVSLSTSTGITSSNLIDMSSLYHSFRTFLRDNDCERQFDRAFYTQCGANVLDETLADILVIDETFLNRCFDWSRTEEGRQFWKELDDKWWKKYLGRP